MANTNTSTAGASAVATPEKSRKNILDRMIDDWNRRPKFWLGLVIVLGLLVLGGILGWNAWQGSKQEAQNELTSSLFSGAFDGTAEERLAALSDSEFQRKVEGTDQAPFYWWLRSSAAHDAATSAEDGETKLARYREALEATEKLLNTYGKTSWASLPWKGTVAAGNDGKQLSLAQRRAQHCKEQIKWLEANKDAVAALKADEGATATLVLVDAEGTEHTLKMKVYSKEAPYSVDQFWKMAQSGWWANKALFGLQQDDENVTDQNAAVLLGSAYSQYEGRHDLYGGEKDWIGFTLPIEKNRLQAKRGRVAWSLRRGANGQIDGADPAQFVIYTGETIARGTDRQVFGEIVESDEALDWLEGLNSDTEKKVSSISSESVLSPEKRITIKSVSVQGAPTYPPASPLNAKVIEPAKPEPLPAPEKDTEKEAEDEADK